ncbi:hypothetical protein HY214_04320 [Candidatus Roizmanbacteria bacterium]|nr:hypothetical protein [Candidatus Roizmanbacteria bacterium]
MVLEARFFQKLLRDPSLILILSSFPKDTGVLNMIAAMMMYGGEYVQKHVELLASLPDPQSRSYANVPTWSYADFRSGPTDIFTNGATLCTIQVLNNQTVVHEPHFWTITDIQNRDNTHLIKMGKLLLTYLIEKSLPLPDIKTVEIYPGEGWTDKLMPNLASTASSLYGAQKITVHPPGDYIVWLSQLPSNPEKAALIAVKPSQNSSSFRLVNRL